jgi:hypothetical protein
MVTLSIAAYIGILEQNNVYMRIFANLIQEYKCRAYNFLEPG